MATFLNNPKRLPVLDTKFAITLEPLLFQYAGSPVPELLVNDYIQNWSKPGAKRDFLKQLPDDVGIWFTPPGKVTDGPSMPSRTVFAIVGFALGLILCLIAPDFWYALLPSVPSAAVILRILMCPDAFYLSGIFHDDLRVKLSTGNATTDGFLRDACTAETDWRFRSYLVYLGVRIGTLLRYKTTVPEKVQKEALKKYASLRGILKQNLWFDEEHSEIRYVIKDALSPCKKA